MKDYCCCAIPLNNVGVYLVLFEQFLVGALAGSLAFATPQVVAYSGPSIGPIIFGVCCYILAAAQVFGFIGVFRQKSALFLRYQPLNGIILLVCFAVAATFIGISASKHDAAVSLCQKTFYSRLDDTTGTQNGESETVCNIFAWIGIGCMGGMWLVLAIAQVYFASILTAYGKGQREDKAKYHTQYNTITAANTNVAGGPNDIQLAERSGKAADPWDSRPTPAVGLSREPSAYTANAAGRGAAAAAGASSYNAAGLPAGAQAPRSRQATTDTGYGGYTSSAYSDPYAQSYTGYDGYNAYPANARVAQEQPTPVGAGAMPFGRQPSVTSGNATLVAPEQSKYHPAEGSFGRKTPRNDWDPPIPTGAYPFAPEYQQSSQGSHDGGSVRRH